MMLHRYSIPWRAVFYRQKLVDRYVKLVKCDASRLSTLLSLFHSGSLTIDYRKYCSSISSTQSQVTSIFFYSHEKLCNTFSYNNLIIFRNNVLRKIYFFACHKKYLAVKFITCYDLYYDISFRSTVKNNETFFAFLYASPLHARVSYRSLSIVVTCARRA